MYIKFIFGLAAVVTISRIAEAAIAHVWDAADGRHHAVRIGSHFPAAGPRLDGSYDGPRSQVHGEERPDKSKKHKHYNKTHEGSTKIDHTEHQHHDGTHSQKHTSAHSSRRSQAYHTGSKYRNHRKPSETPKGYASIAVHHHNVHRRNHSSPAIQWSADLAATAAKITSGCIFAHDTDKDGGGYGQNIAAGTHDIGQIVSNMWYNAEMAWFEGHYGKSQPGGQF